MSSSNVTSSYCCKDGLSVCVFSFPAVIQGFEKSFFLENPWKKTLKAALCALWKRGLLRLCLHSKCCCFALLLCWRGGSQQLSKFDPLGELRVEQTAFHELLFILRLGTWAPVSLPDASSDRGSAGVQHWHWQVPPQP